MADERRWPAGEINIYQLMPELKRQVYDQRALCCWALSVGTGVTYKYSVDEGDHSEEVSPQDIWNRVWYYSSEEERMERGEDQFGGFFCSHHVAYGYVSSRGANLLRNCPFEDRLNKDAGAVKHTELPRIFCGPCQHLDLEGAVDAIYNNVPVTAAVYVTRAFKGYKQGIYMQDENAAVRNFGTHSVLIVGVNLEQGYFRIRNSWGVKWGDEGYGLISFNSISRFSCTNAAWMEKYAR